MAKALICTSNQTNPYANLAIERVLMDIVTPEKQILFLWRNSNTVVIGRNQKAQRECRIEELEAEGGCLARRLSGGGAVYHDLGNLNFTFISPRGAYDVARNLDIIVDAIGSFGLRALATGRNDVEVEGAKVSGNAFFKTKDSCCHHGTLLVGVDTEKLSRYLHPNPLKLKRRGVDSVRARVANLGSLCSALTVESLAAALEKSFASAYGGEVEQLSLDTLDRRLLNEHEERFSSPTWVYGESEDYTHRFTYQFEWGGIDIRGMIANGFIGGVEVYSDALELDFISAFKRALEGAVFTADGLAGALEPLRQEMPEYQTMVDNCLTELTHDLRKGNL